MRNVYRLLALTAFAAACEFVVPASAAGTTKNVAMADEAPSGPVLHSGSGTYDSAASEIDDPASRIVTHGPVRLSPLAGTDEIAWSSAHSVHRLQK